MDDWQPTPAYRLRVIKALTPVAAVQARDALDAMLSDLAAGEWRDAAGHGAVDGEMTTQEYMEGEQ